MDNYPHSLAPEFNEGGGVDTPFEEWWARVRDSFPSVPEDVARYWLHEHWGHSPYRWLPSRDYRFDALDWPLDEIGLIRSRWCDFCASNDGCREHGRYLLTLTRYQTNQFMREHARPPAPIIVLDNRDGHLRVGVSPVPDSENHIPEVYLLVEGHRRFNLALALQEQGKLAALPAWLLTLKRQRTSHLA